MMVADLITTMNANIDRGVPNYKETRVVKIVTFEGMKAYIIGTSREVTVYELQETGEVTYQKPKTDTVYAFHIIKDKMKYGLKFDSLSATKGKKFDIDSLNEVINMGMRNREAFNRNGDRLVYSLYDKKTGKLVVEKYIQNKVNEADSIFRYYDDSMRDIGYSISPFLDKKEKTKLVEICYITNPKMDGEYQKNSEQFTISLKRGSFDKLEELMKLFRILKGKDRK
jgi:hypothetical protein